MGACFLCWHAYIRASWSLFFSHCTNNGIEPQFSLLSTCWYCLLLVLAKGKTGGHDHCSSSSQIQMCFEPCHQAHTICLLPRDHMNFPFAHQLIRQPVKIMSQSFQKFKTANKGLIFSLTSTTKNSSWVSFPCEKFVFFPHSLWYFLFWVLRKLAASEACFHSLFHI